MKDMIWLVKHALQIIFRNKKNILLYLGVPLFALLLSFVIDTSREQPMLHIGVVNQDPHMITTNTIKQLQKLNNTQVSQIKATEVSKKLTAGELDCVIIFQKGYAQSLRAGKPEHIEISSIRGAEITSFVKSYLYQYTSNIAKISLLAKGDQTTFDQRYKNYHQSTFALTIHPLENTSQNSNLTYQTVGYLIVIMLFTAGSLSGNILIEKENKTYFRLLSTPIHATKYVISNVIMTVTIMSLQICIIIFTLKLLKIDPNVPLWQMAITLILFSFVAAGFSLTTVFYANGVANFGAMQTFFIIPTSLIAGCFMPLDTMPDIMQKIAYFLPQRWVLDTLIQLQAGQHFGSVFLHMMILIAFALTFFLIAVYKMSRTREVKQFI